MRAKEAFAKMNILGREHRPFLFVFSYDLTGALVVEDPEKQQEILYHTPLGSNCLPKRSNTRQHTLELKASPIPYEAYFRRFQVIQEGLLRGDSFLANLTVSTPIETSLSLKEIHTLAKAKYKLYLPEQFVSFSPESFVKIDFQRLRIETRPMKGTINANLPDARHQILSNPKEKAEHYTIVDLMRSDLARVASHIQVEDFRYIDKLTTSNADLLQVSSLISGQLLPNSESHLGDIFEQILPAGSITGAPKQATRQIIQDAEGEDRGFYSGVFGFFDGSKVDSGVLIRFIAQDGGQKYYHSGGGITIHSDPRAEYEEIIEKIYIPQ